MSKGKIILNLIGGLAIAAVIAGGVACAIPQSRNAILDGLAPHAEIYKEITAENESLQTAQDRLIADKETISRQLELVNSEIAEKQLLIESLETDLATSNGELTTKTAQIETLNSEIAELQTEKQALEEKFNTISSTIDGATLTYLHDYDEISFLSHSGSYWSLSSNGTAHVDGLTLKDLVKNIANINLSGYSMSHHSVYELLFNNMGYQFSAHVGSTSYSSDVAVSAKITLNGEEQTDFVFDDNTYYDFQPSFNVITNEDNMITNLEIVFNLVIE